uniref:ubiquitinyl hydrolase 1 n=1 Tax=Hirondellea gigas TaxID=1518452 RepID=A0A6A7FRF5_9CRUS
MDELSKVSSDTNVKSKLAGIVAEKNTDDILQNLSINNANNISSNFDESNANASTVDANSSSIADVGFENTNVVETKKVVLDSFIAGEAEGGDIEDDEDFQSCTPTRVTPDEHLSPSSMASLDMERNSPLFGSPCMDCSDDGGSDVGLPHQSSSSRNRSVAAGITSTWVSSVQYNDEATTSSHHHGLGYHSTTHNTPASSPQRNTDATAASGVGTFLGNASPLCHSSTYQHVKSNSALDNDNIFGGPSDLFGVTPPCDMAEFVDVAGDPTTGVSCATTTTTTTANCSSSAVTEGSVSVVYGPTMPWQPFTAAIETTTSHSDGDVKGTACTVSGECGLQNLGNTCFMAAGLQCLINTPPFAQYFFDHPYAGEEGSLVLSFSQLVHKSWSGKYRSIRPGAFKYTFGLHWRDFSDYRQHDCQEFVTLLLEGLRKQMSLKLAKKLNSDSDFIISQKSYCNSKTSAGTAPTIGNNNNHNNKMIDTAAASATSDVCGAIGSGNRNVDDIATSDLNDRIDGHRTNILMREDDSNVVVESNVGGGDGELYNADDTGCCMEVDDASMLIPSGLSSMPPSPSGGGKQDSQEDTCEDSGATSPKSSVSSSSVDSHLVNLRLQPIPEEVLLHAASNTLLQQDLRRSDPSTRRDEQYNLMQQDDASTSQEDLLKRTNDVSSREDESATHDDLNLGRDDATNRVLSVAQQDYSQREKQNSRGFCKLDNNGDATMDEDSQDYCDDANAALTYCDDGGNGKSVADSSSNFSSSCSVAFSSNCDIIDMDVLKNNASNSSNDVATTTTSASQGCVSSSSDPINNSNNNKCTNQTTNTNSSDNNSSCSSNFSSSSSSSSSINNSRKSERFLSNSNPLSLPDVLQNSITISNSKSSCAVSSSSVDDAMQQQNSPANLCSNSPALAVNILDIRKETKTSNVNVLVKENQQNNELLYDSAKYAKCDKVKLKDSLDNLSGGDGSLKREKQFGNNLYLGKTQNTSSASEDYANSKSKRSNNLIDANFCMERKLSELDDQNEQVVSKRIRLDEKNMQHQLERCQQQQHDQALNNCHSNSNAGVNTGSSNNSNVVGNKSTIGHTSPRTRPECVSNVSESNNSLGCSNAVASRTVSQQHAERDVRLAHESWAAFLGDSEGTLLMDTFYGQFKSCLVCSVCGHSSVKFDPFGTLSVPLPHANEIQILVTYISSDSSPPLKCLLTLCKVSDVRDIKTGLVELLAQEYEPHKSAAAGSVSDIAASDDGAATAAVASICSSKEQLASKEDMDSEDSSNIASVGPKQNNIEEDKINNSNEQVLSKHRGKSRRKSSSCARKPPEVDQIVVAEVLDNHIAKILEDSYLTKYVNQTNRSVYAFHLPPASLPPQVGGSSSIGCSPRSPLPPISTQAIPLPYKPSTSTNSASISTFNVPDVVPQQYNKMGSRNRANLKLYEGNSPLVDILPDSSTTASQPTVYVDKPLDSKGCIKGGICRATESIGSKISDFNCDRILDSRRNRMVHSKGYLKGGGIKLKVFRNNKTSKLIRNLEFQNKTLANKGYLKGGSKICASSRIGRGAEYSGGIDGGNASFGYPNTNNTVRPFLSVEDVTGIINTDTNNGSTSAASGGVIGGAGGATPLTITASTSGISSSFGLPSTSAGADSTEGSSSSYDVPNRPDAGGDQQGEWKTCNICLEEMCQTELKTHGMCFDCLLCESCLDMSCKHHGGDTLPCPVCQAHLTRASLIPVAKRHTQKMKPRLLRVCVVFRLDADSQDNNKRHTSLLGHPRLVSLPSRLPLSALQSALQHCLPPAANYTLLLVEGRGYNCSRCLFMSHCRGCDVSNVSKGSFSSSGGGGSNTSEELMVCLQASDTVCVRFTSLTALQRNFLTQTREDSSLALRRQDKPLTLYDCLRAFTRSETLESSESWFCPECQCKQSATKTVSVWRCPPFLIIHLERFLFHGTSSSKVDDKVIFPLENLDMSDYLGGRKLGPHLYNLYGVVCHMGVAQAGHYTALVRSATTGMWRYYNDECVTPRKPSEDEYSSAYLLFFHRNNVPLVMSLPREFSFINDAESKSSEKNTVSIAAAIPVRDKQPSPVIDITGDDDVMEFDKTSAKNIAGTVISVKCRNVPASFSSPRSLFSKEHPMISSVGVASTTSKSLFTSETTHASGSRMSVSTPMEASVIDEWMEASIPTESSSMSRNSDSTMMEVTASPSARKSTKSSPAKSVSKVMSKRDGSASTSTSSLDLFTISSSDTSMDDGSCASATLSQDCELAAPGRTDCSNNSTTTSVAPSTIISAASVSSDAAAAIVGSSRISTTKQGCDTSSSSSSSSSCSTSCSNNSVASASHYHHDTIRACDTSTHVYAAATAATNKHDRQSYSSSNCTSSSDEVCGVSSSSGSGGGVRSRSSRLQQGNCDTSSASDQFRNH